MGKKHTETICQGINAIWYLSFSPPTRVSITLISNPTINMLKVIFLLFLILEWAIGVSELFGCSNISAWSEFPVMQYVLHTIHGLTNGYIKHSLTFWNRTGVRKNGWYVICCRFIADFLYISYLFKLKQTNIPIADVFHCHSYPCSAPVNVNHPRAPLWANLGDSDIWNFLLSKSSLSFAPFVSELYFIPQEVGISLF